MHTLTQFSPRFYVLNFTLSFLQVSRFLSWISIDVQHDFCHKLILRDTITVGMFFPKKTNLKMTM